MSNEPGAVTTEPEQDRESRIHALAEQIDAYLRAEHAPPIWWHLSDLAHKAAGCTWDDDAGDLGAYDCESRPVVREGIDTQPKIGPHDLIISYGDCEFYGSCSCGKAMGLPTRPDVGLDKLGQRWERHVMAEHRDCDCEPCSW